MGKCCELAQTGWGLGLVISGREHRALLIPRLESGIQASNES